jgi:hypothetical protein
MNNFLRRLCLVFSAGCAGGLANSIIVWFFAYKGITSALGVRILPALTPAWLYPRIVWGGIWGALFLLPHLRDSFFRRGLLFSLGPSIVQLLIIFPFKTNQGAFGLALGDLTPGLVLFFNAIWGLVAAYLLKRTQS